MPDRLPAAALGMLVLLVTSCGGERDMDAVAKAIAADFEAAYAKVGLVACRAEAGGTACVVTLGSQGRPSTPSASAASAAGLALTTPSAPVMIDVSGFAEGRPVWKARGRRHMEYELARGITTAVRARPQAVSCPEHGDLAVGFACQVTLDNGLTTPAKVQPASEPQRFAWTVPGLIMLGPVESHIAAELAAQGEKAAVDCGRAIRQSVAGTAFPCELVAESGTKVGTVTVTVIDTDGHVQYRRDNP